MLRGRSGDQGRRAARRTPDSPPRPAGWHAGHLVGEFPHERIDGADVESYITPANDTPLRRTDQAGRRCHCTPEIHLVDRERGFGGLYEELLTL